MTDISLIAFDADDTLWECQTYFEKVEKEYCRLLSPYAPADEISKALFATETANMPLFGYGSKAFILSLLENAARVSGEQLTAEEVTKIIGLGKSLLRLPGKPIEGVEKTLKVLHESGKYHLVVFTKGELQDQENKLKRSGLANYFDDVVVVADKTEEEYRHLCVNNEIRPSELLMIGNSFKSDIAPALAIGAYAVHVPFSVAWKMELAETFDHERLTTIENFKDLIASPNLS
mgnify:CR=1 FL=1